MKKNMFKYFGVMSMCAAVMAVVTVLTTNCVSVLHEPQMPEELKK